MQDHLLLFLDGPFIILLTVGAIACIHTGCVNRAIGLLLLISYVVWVGIHPGSA